jgi:hypothetical protein
LQDKPNWKLVKPKAINLVKEDASRNTISEPIAVPKPVQVVAVGITKKMEIVLNVLQQVLPAVINPGVTAN